MSFELINLQSGRVLPFDSMRIALERPTESKWPHTHCGKSIGTAIVR
jgi:hypothetical protein